MVSSPTGFDAPRFPRQRSSEAVLLKDLDRAKADLQRREMEVQRAQRAVEAEMAKGDELEKLKDRCESRLRPIEEDIERKRAECDEKQGMLKACMDSRRNLLFQLDNVRTRLQKAKLQFQDSSVPHITKPQTLIPQPTTRELQRLVEHLNREIFQVAAQTCDATSYHASQTLEDGRVKDIGERVINTKFLDKNTVKMLVSINHAEDPIAVRISLHAGLVNHAFWIIDSWYLGEKEGLETRLRDMYERMTAEEEKATSEAWRIETCQYLNGPDILDNAAAVSARTILERMVDVLELSAAQKTREELMQMLQSIHNDRVTSIVNMSFKLRRILRDEKASPPFHLIIPRREEPFSAERMEDEFGDELQQVEPTHANVACTTRIGLAGIDPQGQEHVIMKSTIARQAIFQTLPAKHKRSKRPSTDK
ncbi:hypothetical protein K474DRAFT_1705799 [Panus rudis PR-1116 ss-1]|nr:hypothetical protein K474DRAFT_1705799 [Panus rudis PR-1116 ss-1]